MDNYKKYQEIQNGNEQK